MGRVRAIDKDGATLDFYLADRRNAKGAKRFLSAALRRSRSTGIAHQVNSLRHREKSGLGPEFKVFREGLR